VLERNGYRRSRGKRNRWIAPSSSTGIPGVLVFADGRCYSHHEGSDRLADRHAHDAFSAMCALEHGGDFTAALRAARHELGLD
jgi:putative DNA primase/helicase